MLEFHQSRPDLSHRHPCSPWHPRRKRTGCGMRLETEAGCRPHPSAQPDLEQYVNIPLQSRHPYLSSLECLPLCSLAVERELCGDKPSCHGGVWAVLTSITRDSWCVAVWKTALERGACHPCSSGLTREAVHLTGGSPPEDLIIRTVSHVLTCSESSFVSLCPESVSPELTPDRSGLRL